MLTRRPKTPDFGNHFQILCEIINQQAYGLKWLVFNSLKVSINVTCFETTRHFNGCCFFVYMCVCVGLSYRNALRAVFLSNKLPVKSVFFGNSFAIPLVELRSNVLRNRCKLWLQVELQSHFFNLNTLNYQQIEIRFLINYYKLIRMITKFVNWKHKMIDLHFVALLLSKIIVIGPSFSMIIFRLIPKIPSGKSSNLK